MHIQIFDNKLTYVTGKLGMTRTIEIPEELIDSVGIIKSYCLAQRTPEQIAVDEAEEQVEQLQEELEAAAELIAKSEEMLNALFTEFPTWQVGVSYIEGQIIYYQDQLYRVRSEHTSQENWTPDLVFALYQNITKTIDPDIPQEWVAPQGAHDAYNTGDRVIHNGRVWTSITNNNTWEPGVYGWEEEAAN